MTADFRDAIAGAQRPRARVRPSSRHALYALTELGKECVNDSYDDHSLEGKILMFLDDNGPHTVWEIKKGAYLPQDEGVIRAAIAKLQLKQRVVEVHGGPA